MTSYSIGSDPSRQIPPAPTLASSSAAPRTSLLQFRFGFAAILRYVLLALLGGAAVDSHTVLWCILPNLLRLRNLLVR